MERAHTLLPHPDSPTIPSTCLSDILKLTESTARAIPASVKKYVFKSFTSRRAGFITLQCRVILMMGVQTILSSIVIAGFFNKYLFRKQK
jgi:hypothetical protein